MLYTPAWPDICCVVLLRASQLGPSHPRGTARALKMSFSSSLAANIEDCEIRLTAGEVFTVYVIRVESGHQPGSWRLRRRYSQFLQLKDALRSKYPKHRELAKFPSKVFNIYHQWVSKYWYQI